MSSTQDIRRKYRVLIDELETSDLHPLAKRLFLEHAKILDRLKADIIKSREMAPADPEVLASLRDRILIALQVSPSPIKLAVLGRRFGLASRRFGSLHIVLTNMEKDGLISLIQSAAGKTFVWDAPRWKDLPEFEKNRYTCTRQEFERRMKVHIANIEREERTEKLATFDGPYDPNDFEAEAAWIDKRSAELISQGLAPLPATQQAISEADTYLRKYQATKGK